MALRFTWVRANELKIKIKVKEEGLGMRLSAAFYEHQPSIKTIFKVMEVI